jgi:hypothetical protein
LRGDLRPAIHTRIPPHARRSTPHLNPRSPVSFPLRPLYSLAVVVVAAFAAACDPGISTPATPAPAAGDQARFDSTIYAAAVYRPQDVLPLKPAVPDAEGRVRVVTYTNYGGYQPGTPMTLSRDVWVTLVPEVRDSCLTFTGDVTRRLEQLLGLPPGAGYDRFAELRVNVTDLFRPAPDPATNTARPCADGVAANCGASFPADVSPTHVRWIADGTLTLWRLPRGYPWTRLGYTYNWHPGSPRYGASEYVVRPGAHVEVVSVRPTAEYCRA